MNLPDGNPQRLTFFPDKSRGFAPEISEAVPVYASLFFSFGESRFSSFSLEARNPG